MSVLRSVVVALLMSLVLAHPAQAASARVKSQRTTARMKLAPKRQSAAELVAFYHHASLSPTVEVAPTRLPIARLRRR